MLEDGTVAIVDYESEYKVENKIKYISYITRVLERYRREGIYNIQIRMIVIYTADVSRVQTEEVYDTGAFRLNIEEAFLFIRKFSELPYKAGLKILLGFVQSAINVVAT
ncbi:MAG: hypothetical protein NC393_00175 [Clostridium sp.]|nr:hypothetical protein [Clostridium sp.]MCM1170522.1 hypothetical protein [Clostridium sp.]